MKNQIKPIFGINIPIKPAEKPKKPKKTIFGDYGLKMDLQKIGFFGFFISFISLFWFHERCFSMILRTSNEIICFLMIFAHV